jgi:hypothetical protein
MTAGRHVRRRRRAVWGVLLAAIALTSLVRAASADQSVAHGRGARHLGVAHPSPALPPTRLGTAPSGAAGPPPLGAAGPPPLGAAGPPPLGTAGPRPLGAVAAPRAIMPAAPRPGLGPRCEGEGCVDAGVPSRDVEDLPFDGADEQPMDASPRD